MDKSKQAIITYRSNNGHVNLEKVLEFSLNTHVLTTWQKRMISNLLQQTINGRMKFTTKVSKRVSLKRSLLRGYFTVFVAKELRSSRALSSESKCWSCRKYNGIECCLELGGHFVITYFTRSSSSRVKKLHWARSSK